MTVGDAVGLAQVVQDKPVDGDHTYEVAPVAVNDTELPLQIVWSAPALTVGLGLTVIKTIPVSVQPLASVPVTIYVVVVVGDATGLVQEVQDKPVAGVQT